MGKQTRSRKSDNVIGKGKVTPVQVAFIVDRYLSDNNFVRTRSTFRTEASHLISKSPVNEAPKSLLSLGDMLDEYICLKEQKVLLNQEKLRLDQEKFRVQTLLRGMQDAMNAYTTTSTAAPLPSPPMLRPPLLSSVNNTPVMMSSSKPLSESTNFSTPTTSQPALKKRRGQNASTAAPSTSKRTRTQQLLKSSASVKPPAIASNSQQQITPIPSNTTPTDLSPVQGSSVAKCLFNPGPQTPSPSPTVSPIGDNQTPPSSNKKTVTPQQFTSTNRTVITSETIQVSPMKQVSVYSIERNHCITSPLKTSSKRFSTSRDHVKGRLDFDTSETVAEPLTSDGNTESPSEEDTFDFDLPNLDCLGADFNLTDLLGDFDLDFCEPDNGSSPECLSGSPDTTVDDSTGGHELLSGMSSMVTEIRSEQDMNTAGAGPNSVTSVKSVTKCIKVFSPVKSRNP
ncbi:hypothetical protein Hanom_Chr15g01338171 [Helianthus anomalus]